MVLCVLWSASSPFCKPRDRSEYTAMSGYSRGGGKVRAACRLQPPLQPSLPGRRSWEHCKCTAAPPTPTSGPAGAKVGQSARRCSAQSTALDSPRPIERGPASPTDLFEESLGAYLGRSTTVGCSATAGVWHYGNCTQRARRTGLARDLFEESPDEVVPWHRTVGCGGGAARSQVRRMQLWVCATVRGCGGARGAGCAGCSGRAEE